MWKLTVGIGLLFVTLAGCASNSQQSRLDSGSPTMAMYEIRKPNVSLSIYDIQLDGATYRYALLVPRAIPATPVPCILFLHGRGECGRDGFRQCQVGLVPAAIAEADSTAGWGGFVVVAPQKPEFDDSWEAHERLALACLEHARGLLPSLTGREIDRSRTYLTGLSQGGAGTWAIGANHPQLFAAIAPVCGFAHAGVPRAKGVGFANDALIDSIGSRLAAARMPIWAFHGEKDDVVPPEQTRRLIQAVNAAGGATPPDVNATYFPEANHNSWDATYRDTGAKLAAWFLAHPRKR